VPANFNSIYASGDSDIEYWLGPMMAFANAEISITAVDKHHMGPQLFATIKAHIEVQVFNQLLRLRVKRSHRRMARIQSILDEKNDSDDSLSMLEIVGLHGL
jgi:hypothetical protein